MRPAAPSTFSLLVRPLLTILAATSLAAAAPSAAFGQDNPAEPDTTAEVDDGLGATRTLGGHTFIPSLVVEFPFVATSFGSSSGFGMQTVDLGTDAAGTDLGSAKLAAFEEQFSLGVRITDRIGIRAKVLGTVGMGADNKSALIAGANFAAQGGLGATFMILTTDMFYLSAQLAGDYATGALISPLAFGNEVQQSGNINADTLRADFSFWDVSPALTSALALAPFLGFQSSVQFSVSGFKNEGLDAETSTGMSLGFSGTFDAATLFAPVAVLLSYGLEVPFAEGDPIHGVEGGVFYTGLRHLNLGAAIASTVATSENFVYGQLRITHYW
jgi:hypothetical protein